MHRSAQWCEHLKSYVAGLNPMGFGSFFASWLNESVLQLRTWTWRQCKKTQEQIVHSSWQHIGIISVPWHSLAVLVYIYGHPICKDTTWPRYLTCTAHIQLDLQVLSLQMQATPTVQSVQTTWYEPWYQVICTDCAVGVMTCRSCSKLQLQQRKRFFLQANMEIITIKHLNTNTFTCIHILAA